MTTRPGEAYDRNAPMRTWAVDTASDTYFVTARDADEAREVTGWTFEHDGIEDREITGVTPLRTPREGR